MKILIDECLPRKLKHGLPNHDVTTVPEAGWAGTKNGALLRLMTGNYEVFVTIDSNLEHQQLLDDFPVSIIVLTAVNNKLSTLEPLMPKVLSALESIEPGQIVRISQISSTS
jgi:predicted nuclease of predicted toxin-antitoxin system